jgi:hypothetical protein
VTTVNITLQVPGKNLPIALHSVTLASINRYYKHCMRIIAAYSDGNEYRTREFKERMYRGHRQVVDKMKLVMFLMMTIPSNDVGLFLNWQSLPQN